MHHQRRTRLSGRQSLTRSSSPRSQGRQRSWLRRFAVSTALAMASLVGLAATASAHPGGSVAIALSAERLPPGGPLELIGIDFQPHETLDVIIEGPSGRSRIGPVTAGSDGHFQFVLLLPEDLDAGTYTIDVISGSGIIQRELFIVDLAAARPALTPTPVEIRTHPAPVQDGVDFWALAPLVAVAVVALLLVVALRGSRGRAAAAGDGEPTAP
jgi:hypothetical protein